MIRIIHGENISESREELLRQKSSLDNVVSFDGISITKESLSDFFSGGMFNDDKNLIIENLLSKNKKSKNLDELFEILNKNSKDSTILLWEEKEITPAMLKKFPKSQEYNHKIPKLIFTFLDSLTPRNGEHLIKILHNLIQNTSIEIILFMLTRQIRLLLALSSKNEDEIEDLSKLAPWQRGKLEKQSRLFEKEKLKELYNKIYKNDYGSKTGTLNMPVTTAIDILLLDI